MNTRALACTLLVCVGSLSSVSGHTTGPIAPVVPARWVVLDSLDQEVGTVNGAVGFGATVTLLVEGQLWHSVTPQPDRLMNFSVSPAGFSVPSGPLPGTTSYYPARNCTGTSYVAGSVPVEEGFVGSAGPSNDGRVYRVEATITIQVQSIAFHNSECINQAPAPREVVSNVMSFSIADVAGHFVPPFRAVLTPLASTSTEWTFCAPEGGACAFTGTREVRYGSNGSFVFTTLTDGTACTNEVFGDPIVGTVKQCSIQ